jgi:hypothetical protein
MRSGTDSERNFNFYQDGKHYVVYITLGVTDVLKVKHHIP